MPVIIVFLLCFIFPVLCKSQTVNIGGIVKDISGTAVWGALVKLQKINISTTTEADGGFRLNGEVKVPQRDAGEIKEGDVGNPVLTNGRLRFTSKREKDVSIGFYNITGKRLKNFTLRSSTGDNFVSLPCMSNGIYVLCIISEGKSRRVASFLSSYGGSYSYVSGEKPKPAESGATRLNGLSPIDDVLVVTKDGLLDYRVAVSNPDTNGLIITMLPNEGNLIDMDGNIYQTVRIGKQVWVTENIKTTTYNDGTPITHIPDSATWCDVYLSGAAVPAYCIYGADDAKRAKYGVFYNWYVVGTGKLAPHGWRVPTDEDWETLQNYLISHGYNYDNTTSGNKTAKALAAAWDWESSTIEGAVGNDVGKNNSSGFSCLPGGYRHWGGSYYSRFAEKNVSYLWSSTEFDSTTAFHRWLDSHHCYLDRILHHKNTAFPVRIMRDADE